MRLSNAERAVVDKAKLTDYCLSKQHPRGRHKAQVFEQVLGLTEENATVFEGALRVAVLRNDATAARVDRYGRRYTIDFEMTGHERTAVVRSAWIVRTGEDYPRFLTCHVLEERKRR